MPLVLVWFVFVISGLLYLTILVDSCHMTILYIIVVFLIGNKHSAALDFTKNNLKQYNQAHLTFLRTTFPGELLVIFCYQTILFSIFINHNSTHLHSWTDDNLGNWWSNDSNIDSELNKKKNKKKQSFR